MSFKAMKIWLYLSIVGLVAVLLATVNIYLLDEPVDTMTLLLILIADFAALFNMWNILLLWRKVRREERAKRRQREY